MFECFFTHKYTSNLILDGSLQLKIVQKLIFLYIHHQEQRLTHCDFASFCSAMGFSQGELRANSGCTKVSSV